ncbi:MAG: phosphosulfolactate synthase [Vicingaceae bacterium]|nr:MAG: phosphosulfolactate synthase [Vicingaceae bacterium]
MKHQTYYNYQLTYLPNRTVKPRDVGLTMVMDKGLSVRQAEDLVQTAGHIIDVVKLGFGTSLITGGLKEKVKVYQNAGIQVYLGGTLFEAFLVRKRFREYLKLVDSLGLTHVEISDGSIYLNHETKCKYIQKLSKNYTVFSEVGSKEEGILISPGKWISMMQKELDSGSSKVIAEARESGTVGIYRPSGSAHSVLVNKILKKIPAEKIIWEAPKKNQQIYFIKLLGANVNLGNIAPEEAIPVETLRLGLRGDTFFEHLPEKVKKLHKAR